MTAPNQSSTRADAEFEKLRLEIEKLRIETLNLKRSQAIDILVRLTPLLSVIIAVLGFSFTVLQYRSQFDKDASDRAERAKQETYLAQREFMKPLLERQQELYFQASSAAATIATTKDPVERQKADDSFWRLYWGPLVLVESKEVADAMRDFRRCLIGTDACSENDYHQRSLALATAMELSILKTWNINPQEFTQNQFQYR